MEIKERIPLNKVTHSVRAAQAILQYGVGAMVDFPEQTLMTASPKLWEQNVTKIHDERLERLLGIDYIGMPKGKDEDRGSADNIRGISYCRFPEWYFCPKCRRLRPLKKWIDDYRKNKNYKKQVENDPYMCRRLRCTDDHVELVPARIIVACSNGHIDDFPWVKWVHYRNDKEICANPELKITSGASEGVEGINIRCSCGAHASLAGAFDPKSFQALDEKRNRSDFICTGRHPWKNINEKCLEYPHVLLRGSSSVYFPRIVSSLVIPPYSNRLAVKIQNSQAYNEMNIALRERMKGIEILLDSMDEVEKHSTKKKMLEGVIKDYMMKIAVEIGRKGDLVEPVLRRMFEEREASEERTRTNYRREEYEVLASDNNYNDDFVKEVMDADAYQLKGVKRIALIHKVREVQALTGFSRIEPAGNEYVDVNSYEMVVDIKEKDMNWYPGYELRGEGIFIELDNETIIEWIDENREIEHRAIQLQDNYKNSYQGRNNSKKITAKFILLHTLSHLLMKQLSFECGYSIASLKERIYCGNQSLDDGMSGILIYTASGDSEGTMGGLVRQGRPDLFPAIFKKAIKSAVKCSNDPVCTLSQGQGRDSLNLAACYSCTLVPETSCEEYNVFLDRGVVVGTYDNPHMGFYSDIAYGLSPSSDKKINKAGNKSKKDKVILEAYPDDGFEYVDEYENIWSALMNCAEDEDKPLLEELITHADQFHGVSKPYKSASFTVKGKENRKMDVDLLWPDKKVMLFTSDNEDEYKIAAESQWKCFYMADSELSWEEILDSLK